jgi:hypothetical protein
MDVVAFMSPTMRGGACVRACVRVRVCVCLCSRVYVLFWSVCVSVHFACIGAATVVATMTHLHTYTHTHLQTNTHKHARTHTNTPETERLLGWPSMQTISSGTPPSSPSSINCCKDDVEVGGMPAMDRRMVCAQEYVCVCV